MKLSKNLFLPIVLFTLSSGNVSAFADVGVGSGGGGDIQCDALIKKIASNIEEWIGAGGPAIGKLDLSSSLNPAKSPSAPYTYSDYGIGMITKLNLPLDVSCVSPEDSGYPVSVDDSAKICKNAVDATGIRMICDRSLFLGLTADQQIEQVHHEFAIDVPGLEPDAGPISTYKISDQLSADTGDVVERKLMVQSPSCDGGQCAIKPCENLNLRSVPPLTECITSSKVVFQLVARTPDHNKEVWKDLKTGLNWSDRLDQTYTQYNGNAARACSSDNNTFEARGNLDCVQFHLPTIEDFRTAETDGFREVLPNMGYWFWSSSIYPALGNYLQEFNGYTGGSGVDYPGDANEVFSVRCVGQ